MSSRPWNLTIATVLLTAAFVHAPIHAQAQEENGPSPAPPLPPQTARLPDDLRAYASAPLRWRGPEWMRFAGVVATVGVAYHYDDKVHEHFANDGEPNYHEVADALPSAFVFGGMWFAAKLAHSDEARFESSVMRRAIVLETIGSEVIKVAFRRKRPGPGVSADQWACGGLSFPSGHTATAFAIGTVLAESGDDKHRWLRRALGYGLGVGTAYQRLNHDAHWLSDTVAGAALGVVTAKFVMKRRQQDEPRGEFALRPIDGGTMLTYTVPLR
jgi:hypothetical protein